MNCPVCNVQLMMADRQGVEINYCPTCRGVWIDRGGLDKIIDRAGGYASESQSLDSERKDHGNEHSHESRGRHRRSLFDLFD
jgi:Zn-finger nucleic acid-binding protein